MYLLPWRQVATKSIMAHLDEKFYCDIYKVPTIEEEVNFSYKFVKFIETWVNRIKRSTTISLKVSYNVKKMFIYVKENRLLFFFFTLNPAMTFSQNRL